MLNKRTLIILILVSAVTVSVFGYYLAESPTSPTPPSVSNDTVEIELYSDGEQTGVVLAETAITKDERRTGLSNKKQLNSGEGMVFLYDRQTERTFVMRDMSFSIDMIFINSDCTVNTIFHAEKPSNGESGLESHHQYSASGQFVLEVPYNYTDGRLTEGDTVKFEMCENTETN